MKKIMFIILAAVMLLSTITVSASEYTVNEYTKSIYVDNTPLCLSDSAPLITCNDVTYAPVQAMAKAFGYDFSFDENTDTYSLTTANYNGYAKFGETEDLADTALEAVIADPEIYSDKHISVEGYISVGYETDYLFLTYEDYKYYNTSNAFHLNIRHGNSPKLNVPIGELAAICGRFVKLQGVLTQYEGYENYYIKDINLIEAYGEGTHLPEQTKYIEQKSVVNDTATDCNSKLLVNQLPYLSLNEHNDAVPTLVYDGKVYMPLRTYAKAFDLYIKYDIANDTITMGKNCNEELLVYKPYDDVPESKYPILSVLTLINNPIKYNGSFIDISGMLTDGKIYANDLDYVIIDDENVVNMFNNRYVTVYGTFNTADGKCVLTDVKYANENRDATAFPFHLYFDMWN